MGFLDTERRLKVGIVTYQIAKDWDLDTIIANCTEAKMEAVELRTTHAHRVEVDLSSSERAEVKKKFQDSPVVLASLGSAFDFHSLDPEEVKKNIEGTKQYAKLAADVGAEGIKVRPNGLQLEANIPAEQTLEQIGNSLRECGEFAKDFGIEVRVEVHGRETHRVPNMKKIMDYADCDNVFVCWNSGATDLEDGGLESNFNLVKDKIRFVHMRDLFDEEYPLRRLMELLLDSGYRGYCCAEIPDSPDPIRIMKYFRALFFAYQGLL